MEAYNFIKKRLHHICLSVNFALFLKTLFLLKTSRQLPLELKVDLERFTVDEENMVRTPPILKMMGKLNDQYTILFYTTTCLIIILIEFMKVSLYVIFCTVLFFPS